MLISIEIHNFKSIRSSKVRFGSLTCVIGYNGVGKSNLFDAIHFLSLLSERDISQASSEIRRSGSGNSTPLDLIYGRDPTLPIRLKVDMIVPGSVIDDFGELTEPSTSLLTYELELKYVEGGDRLAVQFEQLTHARLGDYRKFTGFESSKSFQHSVAIGSRRGGPLISTGSIPGAITLHGDGGSRGRGAPVGKSPRTVLAGTNTSDYPTVLAAKREMSSWRLLHLEPTAMRSSDSRGADPHVSASGGHLAVTLSSISRGKPHVAAEVVNHLRELNADVEDLEVYQDDPQDQVALRARVKGVSNWLFARSLSDGTLRYIALALMLSDIDERSVLCIEEPENGIHPSRIPNLVRLLNDYAVDLDEPIGDDNPLRQVILNTHSPEVARQMSVDDLVFAERSSGPHGTVESIFRPVSGTWRASIDLDSYQIPPKDSRAVADFIGGSPLSSRLSEQLLLPINFGTAL